MDNKQYDVIGVGEAIMDIITQMAKNDIIDMGLSYGAMINIDADQMQELQPVLHDASWLCGGSVANTLDLIARLGGKTAIIGALGNDKLALSLKENWQKCGVTDLTQQIDLPHTGRCHIFVDEYGERSFATFFGVCGDIDFEQINLDSIRQAQYLLLEGYLWDSIHCQKIYQKLAQIIHDEKLDTKIAFTPSDPLLIKRHHHNIFPFITDYVHWVFCNERELKALFQVTELDQALETAKNLNTNFALTQAEDGITLITDGKIIPIEHQSINPVDATGAGDAWAGGFLYGQCQGLDFWQSAALAHRCASIIIQHMGARSPDNLADLIQIIGT